MPTNAQEPSTTCIVDERWKVEISSVPLEETEEMMEMQVSSVSKQMASTPIVSETHPQHVCEGRTFMVPTVSWEMTHQELCPVCQGPGAWT